MYIIASMIGWMLTKSFVQFLFQSFYQLRRIALGSFIKDGTPLIVGLSIFIFLMRNAKVAKVLEEVIVELKKVSWPSTQDVMKSTWVVILCILFVSFVLAGFDIMWGKVISFFINL